jgi:hypothetical protein
MHHQLLYQIRSKSPIGVSSLNLFDGLVDNLLEFVILLLLEDVMDPLTEFFIARKRVLSYLFTQTLKPNFNRIQLPE